MGLFSCLRKRLLETSLRLPGPWLDRVQQPRTLQAAIREGRVARSQFCRHEEDPFLRLETTLRSRRPLIEQPYGGRSGGQAPPFG